MRTELSNNLKEFRKQHKLSQTNIAEFLKISQRAYSHYETGDSIPDINILIELADFYKISLDMLVGRYKIKDKSDIKDKFCS